MSKEQDDNGDVDYDNDDDDGNCSMIIFVVEDKGVYD